MRLMRAAKRRIHGAALAALLLVVATASTAAAKAGPAAGAAGSSSPLLATVDIGLDSGQHLNIAVVESVATVDLALGPPRSWTYLDDLARFAEDARWRLEKGVQGLAGGCIEPSARLKTRVRGYQNSGGVNEAVEIALSVDMSTLCVLPSWGDQLTGLFVTADPLGYVDGPSMYAFAGFDPVNRVDPLGLDSPDAGDRNIDWPNTAKQSKEEELANARLFILSSLKAEGLDPANVSLGELVRATERFLKRQGVRDLDLADRRSELIGPIGCRYYPVLCEGREHWDRAEKISRVLDVQVAVGVEFLWPMAAGSGLSTVTRTRALPRGLTRDGLQKAIDDIHAAEFGSRGGGIPMSVTVTRDGRVVVSQVGKKPGPKARAKARDLFGDDVEFVAGTTGGDATGVNGFHAEARAIDYLGDDAAGAVQATTHNACPTCQIRQEAAGIENVTGNASDNLGQIKRD